MSEPSADPWLSVLMPVYDGEAYLRHALESIRSATTSGIDIEIVAVDDGSTDATSAILDEYSSILPLRTLSVRRSGNWVRNTNRAAAVARGCWLTILHQDDIWYPDRLRALRAAVAESPDLSMVLHAVDFIDPRGVVKGRWTCPLATRAAGMDGSEVLEHLLVQNFVGMPSPMFRREAFERVGGMDENSWYVGDWDLWLKLAAVGRTRYLSRTLAAFRVHLQSQTISRGDRREDLRTQFERVLELHAAGWSARSPKVRAQTLGAARASIALNCTLMAAVQKQRPDWKRVARGLWDLPLGGWRRLLRDGRLAERISARIDWL